MRSFKDSEGREWVVAVSVWTLKRARLALDLDMYGLIKNGPQGLEALLADPARFVDTLFIVVEKQAAERGLTDEQFGLALGGDTVLAARDAFVDALVDFEPNPRTRDALRKVIAAGKELQALRLEEAEQAIAGIVEKEIAAMGAKAEQADAPQPTEG